MGVELFMGVVLYIYLGRPPVTTQLEGNVSQKHNDVFSGRTTKDKDVRQKV
jgi:hypothetical protein